MKEITGGQGFTIAYDPVGGAFIGDLVAAAQPYGLIVNYGNLRTEPIDIPVLPMLAKRLFFKFHSLYDTMRLPEKRAACFAFVHDQVACGALKVIVDRTFLLRKSWTRTATWNPTCSAARSSLQPEARCQ